LILNIKKRFQLHCIVEKKKALKFSFLVFLAYSRVKFEVNFQIPIHSKRNISFDILSKLRQISSRLGDKTVFFRKP